ncbi:MAG TPA: adenosylcobinamide-GDP ribazoletransferase [Clostridia bacterium]|nr:adenosylcobinamide-GDP ribazoletransferase [Clostridia bacterium]
MLRNTGEDKMIKGFILSLQFLTGLPINYSIGFNDTNIRNSIFFFPLVGAIIGGIGGSVYLLISPLNIEIATILTLLVLIILTGGLHIDGLSDTFDGFLSNRDKENTLEIMKDSRVGAYGVLSIVLLLLFKYILMKNIKPLPMALILSLSNSRLTAGYVISYKKTAKSQGLGDLFSKSNPRKRMMVSGGIYLIILLILSKIYILPLIASFVSGEILSHIAYKKINGLTGDVYGAIIEISECISLLTYWGILLWI